MSTPSHCIAEKPTPLLNTPEYEKIFGAGQLPLDELGLLRAVEAVALPGTKFTVCKQISPFILEVKTQEYPLDPLYIDKRLVKPVNASHPERVSTLPSKEEIIENLKSSLGLPYVWGGNWSKGVPEMASFYQSQASDKHPAMSFKGIDCSGLLYEATNGYTPRNTSKLLSFGNEVISIANVKPLDILIWPGHVVVVLDTTTTIESVYGKGVILSSLNDHLSQNYVIRRFFIK